jgi:hypothetical protein
MKKTQRIGIIAAGDCLLATRLRTMWVELLQEKIFGVMVAARGDGVEPVPIGEGAGHLTTVPTNHSWIESARRGGTSLSD